MRCVYCSRARPRAQLTMCGLVHLKRNQNCIASEIFQNRIPIVSQKITVRTARERQTTREGKRESQINEAREHPLIFVGKWLMNCIIQEEFLDLIALDMYSYCPQLQYYPIFIWFQAKSVGKGHFHTPKIHIILIRLLSKLAREFHCLIRHNWKLIINFTGFEKVNDESSEQTRASHRNGSAKSVSLFSPSLGLSLYSTLEKPFNIHCTESKGLISN